MKNNSKIYNYLLLLILVPFTFYIFKEINHHPSPNSDIFQMIGDGREYIQFKLPINIHPPPIGPILYCLIGKLFTKISLYPELLAASTISRILGIFSIVNIYLILKKKSPFNAFIVSTLVATNQLYIFHIFEGHNTIIFLYFLTLIFLLHSRKHYKLAYFLTSILFLTRYEGAALIPVLFFYDHISKNKSFKISYLLVPILTIIIWLTVLNFHSSGTSLLDNNYFVEIEHGSAKIPNLNPINSILTLIISSPINQFFYRLFGFNHFFSPYINIISPIIEIIFGIFILLTMAIVIISKKQSIENIKYYLYFIVSTLSIIIFPEFCVRYVNHLIWIIYIFLTNINRPYLRKIIIISLLFFNFSQLNIPSSYDHPENTSEYRLVADWLNQLNNNQKPNRILIYNPDGIYYFVRNLSNIIVDFGSIETIGQANLYRDCQDNLLCVSYNYHQQYPHENLYIIITSSFLVPIQTFPDQSSALLHHLPAFQDITFIQEHPQNFIFITKLQDQYNWAKVYQYHPDNHF